MKKRLTTLLDIVLESKRKVKRGIDFTYRDRLSSWDNLALVEKGFRF